MIEAQIFTLDPECLQVIKAFIRGGRVGLVCLQKALPSIFKEFPMCDPYKSLAECGLLPLYLETGCPFPTFWFNPDLDGILMIQPFEKHAGGRKRKSSGELIQGYEAARSSWEKPSNS